MVDPFSPSMENSDSGGSGANNNGAAAAAAAATAVNLMDCGNDGESSRDLGASDGGNSSGDHHHREVAQS